MTFTGVRTETKRTKKESSLRRWLIKRWKSLITRIKIKDKAGRPYILRVIYVAEQMQGEFPVCAALLCDTIRHGITFEELADAGFSEKVIEAVKILDRDPMISIMEHAQKIKDSRNSIAANIALAGLLYDCNLSKFKDIDDEIIAWYDRCIQAIAVFENDNYTNRWRDSDMQYIYTAASTRVLDIKMDAPSIGGRFSFMECSRKRRAGIRTGRPLKRFIGWKNRSRVKVKNIRLYLMSCIKLLLTKMKDSERIWLCPRDISCCTV